MSPDDANAPDRSVRDCAEATPSSAGQLSEAAYAPVDGHGADIEPVSVSLPASSERPAAGADPATEAGTRPDEQDPEDLSAFIVASSAASRAEAEQDDSSSLWGADPADDDAAYLEVRRSAPGWAISKWIIAAAVAAGVTVLSFVMIPRLFTPLERAPAAVGSAPPTAVAPTTLAPPVVTYPEVVLESGPTHYWKFEMQSAGSDSVGAAHLQIGDDALVLGSSAYAGGIGSLDCSGTAKSRGLSDVPETPTGDFSIEVWINTVSAEGGPIVTFGNKQSTTSTRLDRVLYMATNGKVYFGTQAKGRQFAVSDLPVNNGVWRHVVGTMSAATGITIYVDGQPVGTEDKATTTSDFEGYWKVCGDNTAGWPGNSGRAAFSGTVDDVAIYPKALSAQEVLDHYDTAKRL